MTVDTKLLSEDEQAEYYRWEKFFGEECWKEAMAELQASTQALVVGALQNVNDEQQLYFAKGQATAALNMLKFQENKMQEFERLVASRQDVDGDEEGAPILEIEVPDQSPEDEVIE